MEALFIMLKNVVVFVLLALPGYVLVRGKLLKQEQSAVFSKILTYVGMPFLILSSTLKLTFNGKLVKTLLLVALLGVAFTLAIFFLSKPLTKGEKAEKTRGMVRFCSVFSNNGFLGLPLAIAIFGEDARVVTVVVFLNIITNILMFTLGVYLISGDKELISLKKAFLNPVLISFAIGILLNLLNVPDYIPEIVTYSTHFSGIVTPISMTILGMKMESVKVSTLFTNRKTYYVSLLKLIVFPTCIVLVMLLLNTFAYDVVTFEVIMGMFMAFAMPTAGLSSTFSEQFEGDTESAVTFTLGTTLLSIVTIPILYLLLSLIV
jgi:predicted permease